MKKNRSLWITYDFGLKGDYTGLFTWLDNHQAVECGNGIAFLKIDTNEKDYKKILEDIKNDLNASVKLSKNDRIYIIIRDDETGLIKGKFINGGRRQAPWLGYGDNSEDESTDQ